MSDDQPVSPYQRVPECALDLGFLTSPYLCRPIAWTPVPRRTVEETVEIVVPPAAELSPATTPTMWSAEHALREEPNAAVLEHASAEAHSGVYRSSDGRGSQ